MRSRVTKATTPYMATGRRAISPRLPATSRCSRSPSSTARTCSMAGRGTIFCPATARPTSSTGARATTPWWGTRAMGLSNTTAPLGSTGAAGIPEAFAGEDYLEGEGRDALLEAGPGNDTLTGGSGNDFLRGQAGDDVYLGKPGGQTAFVQDTEGANTVRFGTGSFASPSFSQVLGSDGKAYLGLRYASFDTVFVESGLTNNALRYELADGTIKTAADWRGLFTPFVTKSGTSSADTLAGTVLAESFSPGAGNDA